MSHRSSAAGTSPTGGKNRVLAVSAADRRNPGGWRNRITGHGEAVPDQLLANPKNHRIHPYAQQEHLRGVLEQVGWVDEVIVNQRTDTIVNGHLRVLLALRDEQPSIPVSYVDLDEEEEDLILLAFDEITVEAGIDREKLIDLIERVRPENEDVVAMLDAIRERRLAELDKLGEKRPVAFDAYDEDLPTEHRCPKCGYEWSGKPS